MSFDAGSIMALSMAAGAVGSTVQAYGATSGASNQAASIESGAASQAAGTEFSAKAQSDAALYQAAVARNNAAVAEENARYTTKAGAVAEQNQRQKTAQDIGMQRASMAANGIDIGSGTAANIQGDTAGVGEMDALTIRNNAARAAYGYRVQANDFSSSAGFLDAEAKNAIAAGDLSAGAVQRSADLTASGLKSAGNISALSSIVGGASSVAAKWAYMQDPKTRPLVN